MEKHNEMDLLDKEIECAWKHLSELKQKRRDLIAKNINLVGKYVSWSLFGDGSRKYLYVTETFKNGNEIIVRGVGFTYNYSKYMDDSYAQFDAMMDITIPNNDPEEVESNLEYFEEITKQEYLDKLEEMVNGLYEGVCKFL